jgi:DmsE family decaheme c-type cytochrome
LSCHTKLKQRSTWKMRKIADNDLACTSCHQIHQPLAKGHLKKPQPDLCYDCHRPIEHQFQLPSHHPVKEGHLVCTDCHSMKVELVELDRREGVPNGLCFKCHADKRGPFVFEHPPVVEDCSICHEPHGAVVESLLRQNEPFLCLQCHQMHFQTAMQGIEGPFTVSEADKRGGTSHKDGFKSSMLTACTRCHTQIHGSDLPSQSISGQGKAFTR